MHLIKMIIISLVMMSTAYAGNIGLKMGYDLDYKTYAKETDNGTYQSGSQMDNLYATLEYNRDFYRGRLGNMMIKADLNQYGLNFYDDHTMTPSIPFSSGAGADHETRLFHNLNSVLNIRLPKQKISMRLKWDDEEMPQIDQNRYFQTLNKIKDDAKELEGIYSSLNNNQSQSTRNFYIHKSSRYLNIMSELNHYQLDDSNIETAYVSDELTWQAGVDYKNWAGVHYERIDKQHNQSRKDEVVSTLTLGLINAFGSETDYSITPHLSLKNYLKRETTEYQDGSFLNDEGFIELNWVKGENTVTSEYQYNKSDDPDTNDQLTTHRYELFVQNKTKDRRMFVKYDLEKANVYRETIQGLYLDEQDLPAALNSGLIGPGSITFYTLDEPLEIDISGLTPDNNDPLIGSVLVTTSTPYTVQFDTALEGSATVISGDPEDLYALYARTKAGEYDLLRHSLETTYDKVFSRSFRSKTDLLGTYSDFTNKGNNDTLAIQTDSRQLWARQMFEIRPGSFIFDISGRYYYNEEGSRHYNRYELKAKDGFHTDSTQLYLETDWYTRNGNGYDDITEQRYKLIGQHKGDKLILSIAPYLLKKETKDRSIETEKVFRSSIKFNDHHLDIFWKDRMDEKLGEDASTLTSTETKLRYRVKSRHVMFDSSYRTYEKDFEKEEYRTSLTLVTYKPMYQSSTHSKLTLTYEKDYTFLSTGDLEDDYVGIKIAYTPTFKVEAVLSMEKQIRTHDESNDIEFLVKYDADVFSAGIGYRKMKTDMNNERKVEDVVYFQISKGVSFGSFMRY